VGNVRAVQDRLNPILRSKPRLLVGTQTQGRLLRGWLRFAQCYAEAANELHAVNDQHDLVRTQLYGQAAECALKAFLTSRTIRFPTDKKGHDLMSLAELAESHGCQITELQAVALWQASAVFFEDVVTSTRYKGRYPPNGPEEEPVPVASFDDLHEFVLSVIAQSAAPSSMDSPANASD
jgi:HEPN domain-containing protein